MKQLFEPVQLGDILLNNRIIMAPLTRCRSDEGHVPNDIMLEYYKQRAGAGLIISEATAISPMAVGYPNIPGIWSDAQVKAWKRITDAVHQEGGKIFLQLWHVGRISDPEYLNGELPVAPSAIAAKGQVRLLRPKRDFVVPRALKLTEISEIIEDYRKGAENAKAAGFDGVELHGANGYLPNQFLTEISNQRTDAYGGSVKNRARFLLEVLDAIISVYGAGRVGLHISPQDDEHGMGADPVAAFDNYTYLMEEVSKRKIAFVCARESVYHANRMGPELKKILNGAYIVNEDFTKESAEQALKSGEADAVAFGNLFISNPDLPKRFLMNAILNDTDTDKYYFPSTAEGYTDYPGLN